VWFAIRILIHDLYLLAFELNFRGAKHDRVATVMIWFIHDMWFMLLFSNVVRS
jgi:hypothetical protein